jgi:N-hydroxyarylamine O-acetyltransferase
MNVSDYLARIDYQGAVAPNLECLNAVHRQHLLNIPYENLDVQFGRPLDFDVERIFDKLVLRKRGGWCYEMNGLLAWALGEIGFDVMRMVGSVGYIDQGPATLGNHLVLCVQLDVPYLADVGLGNGLIESIPLSADRFTQGHREFRLESLGGDQWRFHNFAGAIPADFDFTYARADEAILEKSCENLQRDPESIFNQNLICQRLRPDGHDFLLGRILFEYRGTTESKSLLDSEDEFADTISGRFGLNDDAVPSLWPRVVARHEALFGQRSSAEIDLGGG